MEARHNLGSLLDVSCCREIQVHITNADRFPGTVSLELLLVNTRLPRRARAVSLGLAAVNSVPRFGTGDRVLPVREVLAYPILADSALQQFNEVAVFFRARYKRQELSAKISIDRFVLIPGRF